MSYVERKSEIAVKILVNGTDPVDNNDRIAQLRRKNLLPCLVCTRRIRVNCSVNGFNSIQVHTNVLTLAMFAFWESDVFDTSVHFLIIDEWFLMGEFVQKIARTYQTQNKGRLSPGDRNPTSSSGFPSTK
jgi:hypothetical protein